MNAILIVSAALAYSVGGYFMKTSEGITRFGPAVVVLGLFCLGAICQMLAMRHHEMSTLTIVGLGLEAIGALVLSIFLLGEEPSLRKLVAVGVVCVGVAMLRQ